MNESAATAPARTAKDAVIEWLNTNDGDFPPGLAAVYYTDGGHTAHLHDNAGNIARLYLRPFGDDIGGWEIVQDTPWRGHSRPISLYWGPHPIHHLHKTLTTNYGPLAGKE